MPTGALARGMPGELAFRTGAMPAWRVGPELVVVAVLSVAAFCNVLPMFSLSSRIHSSFSSLVGAATTNDLTESL